jgi:hypothetical protein
MKEYAVRLADAQVMHQMPIQEDQPGQKFLRGQRVRIDKVMPSCMSHFECNTDAIISYTYAQKFGGNNIKSYNLMLINENDEPWNMVAWYEENQLTLISEDIKDGLEMIEKYAKIAKERNPDWHE